MRKLTPEEKEALKEKLQKEGIEKEGSRPIHLTLTDDKKEELKKMIADAEREKLGRLENISPSRSSKKK